MHSTPPATDSQSGTASLPVMSGLDAPVSPCLQFRLRRFPLSLPSPLVSSSLPAPTCSAYTSGSDCPPTARLSRGKDRATLHYSQDSARAGWTVISRSNFCASGSCRGLRPCPYAICVRLQPRLPSSLHPAPNSTGQLMNARFSLCANINGITRPKDAAGDIYICSLDTVVLPHASFLM